MTQVKHLPIYASAYIFVREIYRIKIKLPRAIKYDLGQECFGSALKILKCIVLANRSQDKGRHISRLLLETEVHWTFLRLLFDLRGLTSGEFKVLSERLSEIEKQAQAWLRWQQTVHPKGTSSQRATKNAWQTPDKRIT